MTIKATVFTEYPLYLNEEGLQRFKAHRYACWEQGHRCLFSVTTETGLFNVKGYWVGNNGKLRDFGSDCPY